MRALKTYIILLCSFLYIAASAQDQDLILPETPGESIVLNTDREIYGVSEHIVYFASCNSPGGPQGAVWSTVLYVELISWDGSKQAASKVLIEQWPGQRTHQNSRNSSFRCLLPEGLYPLDA